MESTVTPASKCAHTIFKDREEYQLYCAKTSERDLLMTWDASELLFEIVQQIDKTILSERGTSFTDWYSCDSSKLADLQFDPFLSFILIWSRAQSDIKGDVLWAL